MGRTPEYLQERLRRFFSKFGIITSCKVNSHELDPYQSDGTGFISFKTRRASLAATRAMLKLPFTLLDRKIKLLHLYENIGNFVEKYDLYKHYIIQIIDITRQIYNNLVNDGPNTVDSILTNTFEYKYKSNKLIAAGPSVYSLFKDIKTFIDYMDDIFIMRNGKISILLTCPTRLNRILKNKKIILETSTLQESVKWNYNEHNINVELLDHLKPLDPQLQLLSKSHDMYRVHDERHLLKIALKRARNQARNKENVT